LKPNPVNKLTEADFNNVDCLLCHAPNYKRTVVKQGDSFRLVPAPDVNVLQAAQSVGRPTNEMCLRCHLGTGGGPNHKHGVTPTSASDVHVAKGLHCVDCHITKQHQIAGGSDLKAQELTDVKVDCSNCHTAKPHRASQAATLNMHTKRIACQTCHIPAIARDPKFPTAVSRDWTKPVLNEQNGLWVPTNKMANNVPPEYRWWNRMMAVPPEPIGSLTDSRAKITPWKRTTYALIGDAGSGKAIFIKAGVYAVTGDVGAAAAKGAEDAKQPYSGKWKPVMETMVFSLNHQVAPKAEALKCNSCHSASGVLDFKALGYSEQRVKALSQERKIAQTRQ
jgi:hypothetical protein